MPMHRKNSGPKIAGKKVVHASAYYGDRTLELWHERPAFVANSKRQRAKAKAARLARRKQR